MDYTPRYSQPFTLAEAIFFDNPVIMEEINRLENSLKKLRETQEFLQSYLEATPDAEIAQDFEENKVVIESQEERITILKMALIEKGILSASHYETATPSINHHGRHSDSSLHTTATSLESPRQAPVATFIDIKCRMPSVSLSPIKDFQIDLANVLHHATILEVKLKEAEEWAQKLDKLDSLTDMSADLGSEWDEDFELTVSDASAITKEKEGKLRDIQQFRTELEEILDRLQGHYETPLEDFLSVEDNESVQIYGQKLISWFESIRGHLIEILGRTSALIKEKEERKKKMKEESKFIQEFLGQMATLQTSVMKTESNLNDIAQRQNLTTSRRNKNSVSKRPDAMDFDDDQLVSLQIDTVIAEVPYPVSNLAKTTGSNFTALLEDTKSNLREFRVSRQTYASKADTLHDQTTNVLHNAPSITPVRNVEIDAIELDPIIRQIVVEEFELLYGHFLSSLADETNKRDEEVMSKLTNTMADGNKLVCKLLFCLGYDEIEEGPLNGRPGYSLGSTRLPLN